MKKESFYSSKEIDKTGALYRFIIGERSNGKTTNCLEKVVKNYKENKKQGALIRRWAEDFRSKRAETLFDDICTRGVIKDLFNGEWTDVFYISRKWYLCRYNEKGERECDATPFMYAFALTEMEHDKSTSFPNVTTIIFDEVVSRSGYLPDEFVTFMNVLSTIIRQRDNVVIYMLGNTVNKFCPYFSEMGLYNVKNMAQGKIDLYTYGDSGLTVAVEYCNPVGKSVKKSDKYFAFNNSRLSMIQSGSWEIDIYPHSPCKFTPRDILTRYFIKFDDYVVECEIVLKDDMLFTFAHFKTTDLQERDSDIIFDLKPNAKRNYFTNILKPTTKLGKKIQYFFRTNRVFYASNDVGEVVNNYLKSCE